MFEQGENQIAEALKQVADCHVVIAAVGGTSNRFTGGVFQDNGAMKKQDTVTMDCGEGVDDGRLRLPGDQLKLLKALKEAGKTVVTVLICGRPYEMAEITEYSDAIFCCFYPGPTGGEAAAKLLFGACEPAGRLSVSLPDSVGQLPVYYNPKDSYRAGSYYNASAPRYRFGSGLSYTIFAYTLKASPEKDALQAVFSVTNTGNRPGWAVPQLYLHRTQGMATARIRQLCGFKKVLLQPGESKTVTIPIPSESLMEFDASMKPVLTPGRMEWFLGDSGQTYLQGDFTL